MSVDHRAVIVVGLRREDIENFDALVDEDRGLLEGLLREYPTYYDGGGEDHNVIGIVVAKTPNYNNTELHLATLASDIEKALISFKELTDQDGEVYLSVHGH